MALLSVTGGDIYFELHKTKDLDKPCVVFSHGFGMGCRVWDNSVAFLVDHNYPVLVYDHRGCGRSDKDFQDVSINALGDDLVSLAATAGRQGITKFVFNGWYLGGAVVVDAAAKMTEGLAGVISTGGATPRYTRAEGFPHGGLPEDVRATVAALRGDRVNFLKGLYFEGVFAAPVSDEVKQWCYAIALQASPAADASLAALADMDQRELLAALQVPCLFITGTEDAVVAPGIAAFAAQHAARGRLAEMPGCGHAPFLEAKDNYHKLLVEFLEELESV